MVSPSASLLSLLACFLSHSTCFPLYLAQHGLAAVHNGYCFYNVFPPVNCAVHIHVIFLFTKPL